MSAYSHKRTLGSGRNLRSLLPYRPAGRAQKNIEITDDQTHVRRTGGIRPVLEEIRTRPVGGHAFDRALRLRLRLRRHQLDHRRGSPGHHRHAGLAPGDAALGCGIRFRLAGALPGRRNGVRRYPDRPADYRSAHRTETGEGRLYLRHLLGQRGGCRRAAISPWRVRCRHSFRRAVLPSRKAGGSEGLPPCRARQRQNGLFGHSDCTGRAR